MVVVDSNILVNVVMPILKMVRSVDQTLRNIQNNIRPKLPLSIRTLNIKS